MGVGSQKRRGSYGTQGNLGRTKASLRVGLQLMSGALCSRWIQGSEGSPP